MTDAHLRLHLAGPLLILAAIIAGCRSTRPSTIDTTTTKMQLAAVDAAQHLAASQVDIITNAPDLLVNLMPGSTPTPPRARRQLPADTPVYITIHRSVATSGVQSSGAAHWDAASHQHQTRRNDYVSIAAATLAALLLVVIAFRVRRRP